MAKMRAVEVGRVGGGLELVERVVDFDTEGSERCFRSACASEVFIGTVLAVLAAAKRIDFPSTIEQHALSAATYAIGTMAAFWFSSSDWRPF